MTFIAIGRMPLGVAWGLGWILGMGATLMIANSAAGSAFDREIFFLWLLVPAGLTPIVASIKGRRLIVWTPIAIGLFLTGIVQPFFQPMMVFLAVTLGSRPLAKIPESELEADESISAMRSSAYVNRQVGAIQLAMAEEYVRRDVVKLGARIAELKALEEKIAAIPGQKSERGHRARIHVAAATRVLLRASEEAASIDALVRANPDLQSFIDGQAVADHRKVTKRMVKELASLEDMVARSGSQLLVANAVLDALGYQAPQLHSHDSFVGDDAARPADVWPSSQAVVDQSKPRRPKRRTRF